MTALILVVVLCGQCADGQCTVSSRVIVSSPAFTAEFPLHLEPVAGPVIVHAPYVVTGAPVIVHSYVEHVHIVRRGWRPFQMRTFRGVGGGCCQ